MVGVEQRTFRTIDLFAGAGGLSCGMHMAQTSEFAYEPVLAVEHDEAAAATFKANFGDTRVISGDVATLVKDDIPEADVVVGGPPCQGFSSLGRDVSAGRRVYLNSLWTKFIDVVRHVQPKAFVIENVPQFLRSPQFAVLDGLMAQDELLSRYSFNYAVLNAADYGVPQLRKRVFVVGMRDGILSWPPSPTHYEDGGLGFGSSYKTVRDAIGDLPRDPTTDGPARLPSGLQDLHIRRYPTEKSLDRYRRIPEGGNRFDLPDDLLPPCWKDKPTGTTDGMGRMWWNRPSPTIRTEFFKPEKGRYLHPEEDRAITHREAARLQTFPDDYVFEGTKIQIARQIGNAVPPVLGRAIGTALAEALVDADDERE